MTTYTIMKGDSMSKIASKYGIELNELLSINPQIVNPNLIFPGQTVNIPDTSTSKSSYTVKSGDSMWKIATKYGIGLNDLLSANPQIINSTIIYPGQVINIPGSTNVTEGSDEMKTLETEVIRLVNVERAKAGRPALTENSELNRLARLKSKDFINNNYFSHTSPTYGTPFDMFKANGVKFTAAAENIANGQRTAAEAMNSWMNSSGHRSIILSPAYNQIGVGVAKDKNGNLYWTQMFIKS